MDKWERRKALSDCIYEKLMETGKIRKCDAKRAANAVARPGIIQSIEELQKIMEDKNWYKNYRQIGKKSADVLEKAFKDKKIKTTIDRLNRDKAIKEVANWWNDLLPIKLMEECAELQQAVSKFEMYLDNEVTNEICERALKGDIIREMADVQIAVLAYCEYFEIDPHDIAKAIDDKLQKKYRE